MKSIKFYFPRIRKKFLLLLLIATIIFFLFHYFSLRILNNINSINNANPVTVNNNWLKLWGTVNKDAPIGVLRGQAYLYLPDENGSFQCIKSKEKIPFKSLNDDYCDCKDFSDEPGTAACHNSKFYCKYQFKMIKPQAVSSSKVNDGICDCCDGSDEWFGMLVPKEIRISENAKVGSVFHAPCQNKCSKILEQLREKKRQNRIGHQMRLIYLKDADKVKNKEFYGPHGIFYKLSQSCFKYTLGSYNYEVCPFKAIRQQKFPQPSILLGKSPSWEHRKPENYVLKMVHGDSKLCAPGQERQTKIKFVCGPKDQVLKITEEVRCYYVILFETPAAC